MHVCMYEWSMYGYALRRALRCQAQTWHLGREWAKEILEHIFKVSRSKSSRDQIALEMPYSHEI